MYCSNCGNKLSSDAAFCPKCGAAVKGQEVVKTATTSPVKGKSTASMVLGIIGVVFAFLYFIGALDLDWSVRQQMAYNDGYRFGYALGCVLIPLTLAIIGICLAVSARKIEKDGKNTAGFWLAISTFAICGIIFLVVLSA